MPIHDWSKVVAGNFHDFHQSWIIEIRNALNDGLLPEGFYALAEQAAKGLIPDVLTLQEPLEQRGDYNDTLASGSNVLSLSKRPPQVRYRELSEVDIYATRADHVAVRHANGDRIVALVEIVSLGNKTTEKAVEKFVEKLFKATDRGCHSLVIDLHRPQVHDPRGVHALFWEHIQSVAHGVTEEQPYGVSSYCADVPPVAWFEPIGLGEPLPNMPLFLSNDYYIDIPLETTYVATWNRVPKRWRDVIEAVE